MENEIRDLRRDLSSGICLFLYMYANNNNYPIVAIYSLFTFSILCLAAVLGIGKEK